MDTKVAHWNKALLALWGWHCFSTHTHQGASKPLSRWAWRHSQLKLLPAKNRICYYKFITVTSLILWYSSCFSLGSSEVKKNQAQISTFVPFLLFSPSDSCAPCCSFIFLIALFTDACLSMCVFLISKQFSVNATPHSSVAASGS